MLGSQGAEPDTRLEWLDGDGLEAAAAAAAPASVDATVVVEVLVLEVVVVVKNGCEVEVVVGAEWVGAVAEDVVGEATDSLVVVTGSPEDGRNTSVRDAVSTVAAPSFGGAEAARAAISAKDRPMVNSMMGEEGGVCG